MGKYEISVITPLHNVALNIFSRTVQSMRDQTFGFANIEWVVVVHNSSGEYEKQIQAMFDGDENVRVEILHDGAHSPSSPRNKGLDIATGDYIGFLDGDDRYTPECISTALRHIKRTGADICMFRREVELENDASLILNEKVLWDQTREEIVVNKDTWDGKKIFCSMWAMVTHKLYRGELLRKHGLRFDETIEFAEDAAFNIEAFKAANDLCLLPQLIGYVYYVNSASIVQSVAKSDEQLLIYARGFKKVMDAGLRYGFYMNDVLHSVLMFEAGAILAKGHVDEGVRREICALLAPYAKMMKPIEPLRVYTPKYLEDLNNLPLYFLQDDDLRMHSGEEFIIQKPGTVPETILDYQKLALYHILEKGMNSDYGQRYHFSQIVTIDGYRSRLPLTNYDTYQPMIKLAVNINETDIFTDEEIIGYIQSYGRFGVPRKLPVTSNFLAPFMREMKRMLGGKKVFLMSECWFYRNQVHNLDTTYTSTLKGFLLKEFLMENMQVADPDKKALFSTPAELLLPDDKLFDREYPRLFFALRERDVQTIYAPNAWIFLNNMMRLAKDWKRLCCDIEAGRISRINCFPEEKLKMLNSNIAPDPVRAKELRAVFEGMKDEMPIHLLKSIWPSLTEIIADGTGSYSVYGDIIRDRLRDVKYNNDFLASEEGFLARAVPDTNLFELDLSSNFYEFIPLSGGDGDKPVMAHELKPGGEYRVIVSGFSGLYRYRTNILVRCEQIHDRAVVVSSLCMRNNTIHLMEGITEETVYRAVQCCAKKTGILIADYVFIYDDEQDGYSLVLEPAGFGDYLDRAIGIPEALQAEITRECRDILGTKKQFSLSFSEPSTQVLYAEMIQYRRKVSQDAVRPCHIIDNALERDFFLKLRVES